MANNNITVSVSDENSVTVTLENEESASVTIGDTGLRGRPGLVWRDSWSPVSDYYTGDAVRYNGSSFICTSFIAANSSTYPPATVSNWALLAESGGQGGGASVMVDAVAPLGHCLVDTYSNEIDCLAAGHTWELSGVGDLWFNTSEGRLYTLSLDTQENLTWFASTGYMDASDIVVASSGDLPAGSLQDVLRHLEDQVFTSATTPTGSTTNEGDLWYDTSTDQMKFLRNGVWEVIVQKGATSDTEGYDVITLNGGYF